VQENWPHLWDRPEILKIAERKMTDLHGHGIRVDLTTVDLGLPNKPFERTGYAGCSAPSRYTDKEPRRS